MFIKARYLSLHCTSYFTFFYLFGELLVQFIGSVNCSFPSYVMFSLLQTIIWRCSLSPWFFKLWIDPFYTDEVLVFYLKVFEAFFFTDHVLPFSNLPWMQLPLKFLQAHLCKWGNKWQIFASTFCFHIVNFAPLYRHLDSLFFLRPLSYFPYTPLVYMVFLLIIYLISFLDYWISHSSIIIILSQPPSSNFFSLPFWNILWQWFSHFKKKMKIFSLVDNVGAFLFLFSALIKSTGLRNDGRIDDRSIWFNYVSSLSTPLAVPLVYPRMFAIHNLNTKVNIPSFTAQSISTMLTDSLCLFDRKEMSLFFLL